MELLIFLLYSVVRRLHLPAHIQLTLLKKKRAEREYATHTSAVLICAQTALACTLPAGPTFLLSSQIHNKKGCRATHTSDVLNCAQTLFARTLQLALLTTKDGYGENEKMILTLLQPLVLRLHLPVTA